MKLKIKNQISKIHIKNQKFAALLESNARAILSAVLLLHLTLLSTPAFSDTTAVQNFSYSCSLLTDKPAVGDTAAVLINLKFFDNPALWIFDTMPAPTTMGLEFVGSATKTETQTGNNSKIGETIVLLRFSPKREGQLTISPWQWRIFHFQNGDTSVIDTFALSFPGYALTGMPERKGFVGMLPFILFFAGIILVIAVAFAVKKIVKKSKELPMEPPRPSAPEEIAFSALQNLSPLRSRAEDLLDNLSKILRTYINEKFDVPASGMSSAEILSALSERGLSGQRFVLLQQVLKYCDDIRFAEKYPQSDELKEILEQAKNFTKG